MLLLHRGEQEQEHEQEQESNRRFLISTTGPFIEFRYELRTVRLITERPGFRFTSRKLAGVDHQALKPLAFSGLFRVLARFLNPRLSVKRFEKL
jgi:hypothetical protein